MSNNPWASLPENADSGSQSDWLQSMLARNAACSYLSQFGSPQSLSSFRERVPLCSYEDLLPQLEPMQRDARDVLFAGSPVAWERTGGSSGGSGRVSSRYSMMASDCSRVVPSSSLSAGTRICGLIARYAGSNCLPPSRVRWIEVES